VPIDARSYFASQSERLRAGPRLNQNNRQIGLQWWEAFEENYRFGKGTGQRMMQGLARASNDELNNIVFDLLDAMAPSIRGAIERVWIPYFESIRKVWPVKSGQSYDQLAIIVRLQGKDIKAEIISGAPYTFFIRNTYLMKFVPPNFKGRFYGYTKQKKLFFFIKADPDPPRTKNKRGAWNEIVRGKFDRVKVEFVDAIESNLSRELRK
jgi:hypothetical protein